MDRAKHLTEAEHRLGKAHASIADDPNGACEFIWGAQVHAMSAADPEHELVPRNPHGNIHPAPNTGAEFEAAAKRVQSRHFTDSEIEGYLEVGQRKLHNHFYHLNLPDHERGQEILKGLMHAEQILQAARSALGRDF